MTTPLKYIATQFVFLPYLAVAAVWWLFASYNPVPFWQVVDEYPMYSLSCALSIESHVGNSGYIYHPGIPFSLLSWIAFRLTALGIATSPERMLYVVNNSETFWFYAKIISLAINLSGMLALGYFCRRKNILVFAVASLTYFSITHLSFERGLVNFGNDSFSLLFISTFYCVAAKYLSYHRDNGGMNGDASAKKYRYATALAIGALAALGWSIKIYYLVPAAGLVLAVFISAILGYVRRDILLKDSFIAAASFVFIVMFVAVFIMGSKLFFGWAHWTWNMLTHVNRYGSGDAGFTSLSALASSASAFTKDTEYRFPIVFLGIASLSAILFFKNASNKHWRQENAPLILAISIGTMIHLLAVLKHYHPASAYSLPLGAYLACLIASLSGRVTMRFMATPTVIVGILAAMNLLSFTKVHKEDLAYGRELVEDQQYIESLPIAEGEKRLWGYRSVVKPSTLSAIVYYSRSPLASKAIFGGDNGSQTDVVGIVSHVSHKWKYVMFPKLYYHSVDNIKKTYRDYFDFQGTDFQIHETHKFFELKKFFVLVRNETQ